PHGRRPPPPPPRALLRPPPDDAARVAPRRHRRRDRLGRRSGDPLAPDEAPADGHPGGDDRGRRGPRDPGLVPPALPREGVPDRRHGRRGGQGAAGPRLPDRRRVRDPWGGAGAAPRGGPGPVLRGDRGAEQAADPVPRAGGPRRGGKTDSRGDSEGP